MSVKPILLQEAVPYGYNENFAVEAHKFDDRTDVMLYRKKDNTPFLVEAFAEDGSIYLQAEVNGDIKYDGAYRLFYNNGQIQLETSKTPDSRDERWSTGFYKEYYEDGTLKIDGHKGNGLLKSYHDFCGLMRKFYPNGQLKTSTTYNNNGQKEGHHREFSEDGTPKLEAVYQPFGYAHQYLNSTFVGPYKEFYPNGKVKLEGTKAMYGDVLSIQNCFVGIVKAYYENGNLKSEDTYTDTEQRDDSRISASTHEGMCHEYDEEGRRTRSYMVKSGQMLGPYTEYWPNGKVKIDGALSYNFDKDKVPLAFDGPYKEYYEDGTLKINGTRNSSCYSHFQDSYKEYHPNGKLKIDGTRVGHGNFAECRKEYYANGQLKCESNYATRLYYGSIPGTHLSGPYKEYAEDGTLLLDCMYDYHLKGPYKKYNAQGQLTIEGDAAGTSELTFAGPYKEYYTNGALKIETTAKSHYSGMHGMDKYETLMIGIYKEYDENGSLKIETLRNPETGKFDGPYLEYHDNGALKIRTTKDSGWNGDKSYEEYYSNGYLKLKTTKDYNDFDGAYSEYYDNGVLKMKGVLKNKNPWNQNAPTHFDGAFVQYHRNGSLFFATNAAFRLNLAELDTSPKRPWLGNVTVHGNGTVTAPASKAWGSKGSYLAVGDTKGHVAYYGFNENRLEMVVAPPEELAVEMTAPRLMKFSTEELVKDARAKIYGIGETTPQPEYVIA